jgi:hypothetical protein
MSCVLQFRTRLKKSAVKLTAALQKNITSANRLRPYRAGEFLFFMVFFGKGTDSLSISDDTKIHL